MGGLIVIDEEKRLTADQALGNQWLAGGNPVAEGVTTSLAGEALLLVAALRRFAALDHLQRLLLVAVARLSRDAVGPESPGGFSWYGLFLVFDKHRRGQLQVETLVDGLEQLLERSDLAHRTQIWEERQQLEQYAAALDIDGTGAVSWAEWCALACMRTGVGAVAGVAPPAALLRALDVPSLDGALTDLAALWRHSDEALPKLRMHASGCDRGVAGWNRAEDEELDAKERGEDFGHSPRFDKLSRSHCSSPRSSAISTGSPSSRRVFGSSSSSSSSCSSWSAGAPTVRV